MKGERQVGKEDMTGSNGFLGVIFVHTIDCMQCYSCIHVPYATYVCLCSADPGHQAIRPK